MPQVEAVLPIRIDPYLVEIISSLEPEALDLVQLVPLYVHDDALHRLRCLGIVLVVSTAGRAEQHERREQDGRPFLHAAKGTQGWIHSPRPCSCSRRLRAGPLQRAQCIENRGRLSGELAAAWLNRTRGRIGA